MSEVKHTPLPWSVDEDGYVRGGETYGPGGYRPPVPLASGYVEQAFCGSDATHESTANARLIVQAVNSHGDLVEALRRLREAASVVAEDRDFGGTALSELRQAKYNADRALSKVLELGEGL